MKLHLPTGLRAALIAALTAVGSFAQAAITTYDVTKWDSYSSTAGAAVVGHGTAQTFDYTQQFNTDWSFVVTVKADSIKDDSALTLLALSLQQTGGTGLAEGITLANNGSQTATLTSWSSAAAGGAKALDLTGVTDLTFVLTRTTDKNVTMNVYADDDFSSAIATATQGGQSFSSTTVDHIALGGMGGMTRYNHTANQVVFPADTDTGTFEITKAGYLFNAAITANDLAKYYNPSAALLWHSTSSPTWDLSTANWVAEGDTTPIPFADYASAVFGSDSTLVKNIEVSGAINVDEMNVQADYTFTVGSGSSLGVAALNVAEGKTTTFAGSGNITTASLAGAGDLVYGSTGVMTLNGENTAFTGDVTISNGTLKLGHKKALGEYNATSGRTITISAGGVIDLNGTPDANYAYTLNGGTLTNTGRALTHGESQTVRLDLLADSTVQVANGHDLRLLGPGYAGTALNLNDKTLVKTADGLFALKNTTVSSGTIEVQGGEVNFDGGSSAANIIFNGGNITGTMILSGNVALTAQQAGRTAAINASSNAITIDGAGTLTVGGTISNAASITKKGDGTAIIESAIANTPTIDVQQGTLKATVANALGTGAVDVDAAGTLDLAVGNALGSTQAVTNAGNVVLHETLTSGSITGGTVTVDMESTGGLEDADGSRDTGNGFSLGGAVTVRSATASITNLDTMMFGGKDCLSQYNYDTGILTLGEEDWTIYQLNVYNDAQPALAAIQAKSAAKGKSLVSISVGGTEEVLLLQNDTTDGSAKTSLFTGSNLANLYVMAGDNSVMVVDADFAGSILSDYTLPGSTATVRLTESGKNVQGISAQSMDEVNTIKIEGSGKSVNVAEMTASLGEIQILDGVTVNATSVILGGGTGTQLAVKAGAKLSTAAVDIESVDGSADAVMTSTFPFGSEEDYELSSTDYSLANAKLTVNSATDVTLGNARTGKTSLVNAGTGKVTDSAAAVTAYEVLNADGGDIALAGKSGVTVGALTLADGRTVTSDSAVTVTGTATFGSGTAVISALTFNNGSTLDEKGGVVSLGDNDLTLVSSITLGDTLKSALDSISSSSPLTLFSGVSSLTLGGGAYSDPVDAATIFSGLTANKYLLSLESDNTVIISKSQNTDRYWKKDQGSGTWNYSSAYWTEEDGTGDGIVFEPDLNAHFTAEGKGGEITLGESVTAASITVSGADYTFNPGGFTLTVTDSVEVTDAHTATFNMALSGAEKLTLSAKNGGTLVLNQGGAVKSAEIGSGSTMRVAASKSLTAGSVTNNGTLEVNGTGTVASLTLGDGSSVSGSGTLTVSGTTTVGGAATLTGSLTTGTLTGGPLAVSGGNLTLAGGSLGLVQFVGTSSLTSTGTVSLDQALGNVGTLTLAGTYNASNLGTAKSDPKYVEGVTTGNGFEQARLTLTIVDGGTTSASGATILYRDRTLTEKVEANGKVTFDGDINYTKFYVNTGSELASTALENASQKLGTFELADNTTLEVDKNISMSMVNVAADKSATMQIDSGSTVTTDGTTKALTLKGAGTLAVDAGKATTGVTLDNTWTGTVSFKEAELATLDGAWKSGSTVSLTGVTGSLGSTPIEAAIILNKGTDDWGFGQTAAGTQVVTLNGAITGDGNLGVKSSIDDSAFNLNGNIDGWSGNFIANADTRLTLGGSSAKTVNGTVSGTDLKVIVNADTTFNGALNVENLVMGTSKVATLQADSTVDEVNASSGTLKVAAGKKLTVIVNAHPEGIKLGVGSSIILKDDAYMGGNDYGYYGGTVANGTDLEQAMDINNAGITVTDTTLGTTGNTAFSVHNNLVNASFFTLNELQKAVELANVKDSLEIVGDLAIGATGSLKVADGDAKQDVNISSASSLITAAGAQMDANLIINNGVTANMGGALDMNGGALTLIQSATLTGNLYDQIAALEGGDDSGKAVNLFTEVSALTLGNTGYSEPVRAMLYFSNLEDLDEKGDYWLEYDAGTDIVSIRFESTSAHTLTWNGTATEHRWVQDIDTVTDWLEGNPAASAYFQAGDNAKFTADAAEKTVTIVQDITARNITIDSPDCYTFENSDDYSITAQKFEMTGHDGLAKTGEGKLTLDIIGDVSLTESALMVQEGSLEIGTAAKSGKLDLQASALEIAEDAELSVASIEGDGTSSIELAGTMTVSEGTVSNLTATEGSLLKIADLGQTTAGTLSVKTDTTLYGLENGGTLDLGNKTLNLMEQTEQGGNVTAGKLNLAENGNEFKELGTNRVTYAYGSEGSGQLDADAPNLVVDSIAPTMVIPSIALDVTEAMGDGGSLGAINRLGDEVTYTLIHANNQALVAGGFTLVGEALLIQNGLLHAESGLWSDGNNLNLTVGGLDLTWYTSNDETEWGYQVMSGDALTDGANTLNGVQHVLVDEDRTVDVTGVGSEPGLRVRNLAGLDGSTITFSGEEGDTVNLITTEETASNVNLAAENITVKVGLDELDGMDPEDYKDLRVGDVDLTGATLAVHSYEDLDAAFTVNTLSGDDESTLKGRVIVEGQGGEYFGGYENAYVILHENAEQTLAAGEGLTVAGLGAAKLAYVGPETHMDGIEGINMTVTLNDPKQDNSGATLVLDKPSWLVDGTIISGMSAIKSGATLDTAEAPNLIQAAGLNLDGTTIILNQDAADDSALAMTVNALGKTKGLYLAHLGAEDSNTDRVLLNGYLYNKYYQNARLERGMLLVDRRDAFFTEDVVRPTTVNGRAGAGMLDDALLEINPQATNPQGDLAAVMTALETNAVANPDRVAAAVAGASAAALGHAFNNDVQRQLRAIRNRTTTMGLAECVKHEGLPYVNAWVNAEGDYRKLDADGTLAGYTLSSWGGTIGCDVDLTGRLTVGAAFTVLHGEFTSHSADMCEGDLDRDYVSLFARYGYRAWTHTFVATLGFAKSKVDRTVNYGTGSYTTRGDSDGNAFGFLYEVGYTKALNEDASTCLQPIFNVNYRHSSLGGYTEKGGSDAALSVGSADMDAVTFGLGARLQSIVGTSVYNRATLFEGRVLAKLDAGDRDCTTNSSLIGVSAKRSVKSAEVGAFGVEVGAGLTIPVGETGGSIFMDVTGDFRSGYTEFNGTVGYRFSF